ncbi:hypothetical protein D3C81_144390 [compost metagenome]
MNVILVPQWLKRSLEYAKMDLSTVKDLDALIAILSPEDVAKYLHLQQNRGKLLSPAFEQAFPSPHYLGPCAGSENKQEKISYCLQYLNVKNNTTVVDHWFGRDDGSNVEYTLEVTPLGADTLIITPMLGQAGATASENGSVLMDRIVGQWVIAEGLEKVAQTAFFKEYLLSIKST